MAKYEDADYQGKNGVVYTNGKHVELVTNASLVVYGVPVPNGTIRLPNTPENKELLIAAAGKPTYP